jgi:hypothetical protein
MAFRIAGPCAVEYAARPSVGASAGNYAPLGKTQGGVVISTQTDLQPVQDDVFGESPAGLIFTGKLVRVTFTLLQPALMKAAKLVFGGMGGIDGTLVIGTLASQIAGRLRITERDGSSQWVADFAFASDPETILLSTVKEMSIPISLICLPSATGKAFSTVPTYVQQ